MSAPEPAAVESFIARWKNSGAAERANAQLSSPNSVTSLPSRIPTPRNRTTRRMPASSSAMSTARALTEHPAKSAWHLPPGSGISVARMTPAEFKKKWAKVTAREMSACQSHFGDLCRLLHIPPPLEADPSGETFCCHGRALFMGWAN